jgi:subtilisin family serine protease
MKLGTDELELKDDRRREDADLQYDPHLQEEKLRSEAQQPGTIGITCEKDDGRWVDVIAKLNSAADAVPAEIKDYNRIGDVIVTGTLPVDTIPAVRKQVESLKAASEVHLHLYNSVPAIGCDPASLDAASRGEGQRNFPGLDGSGVIIGIVDSGCDFRHKNFRHPSGATRIRALWDQTDIDKSSPATTFKPPQGFSYGRELRDKDINDALETGDAKAYGALGYTPPLAAHGTHVMDIAAGNGRELNLFNGKPGDVPPEPSAPGVAPNAQIVFVNLKTFERGFLGNSRYLLDAVDYVFKKADELGMPAVVNLSLSTTGGPHDGTTLVEQGFDALVNAAPGRAIVTSAGNSYLLQSHITGKIGKAGSNDGGKTKILWQTDSRHTDPDRIKNEMEIWYPKGKAVGVNLYAPDGRTVGSVSLGETKSLYAGTRRVGRISHRKEDPNNGDNQVDIRLPFLEDDGMRGPWQIEIASEPGEEVELHAWIEQSERGLARFTDGTDSQYTLGSICCSAATLTVGAFDTAENASLAPPLEATSAGPIRPTQFNDGKELSTKPELSAPGSNVVAARAQGGVTVLSGSSMAAAHISGLVALLFQLANRSGRGLLPFSETRRILTAGIVPLTADPSQPDLPLRLGKGRINGPASVQALLEPPQQKEPAGPPEPPSPPEPSLSKTVDLRPPEPLNGSSTRSMTSFVKKYALSNGSEPEEGADPFNQVLVDQFKTGKGVRVTIEPLE